MALPAYKDDQMAGLEETARAAIDDAKLLADLAVKIQEAETTEEMASILSRNLQFWTVIKLGADKQSLLPDGIRSGLIQLADYITATTLRADRGALSDEQIQALITINLRISAGLIEGQLRTIMGEDAFRNWDEEGRPMGPEFEQWLENSPIGQANAA